MTRQGQSVVGENILYCAGLHHAACGSRRSMRQQTSPSNIFCFPQNISLAPLIPKFLRGMSKERVGTCTLRDRNSMFVRYFSEENGQSAAFSNVAILQRFVTSNCRPPKVKGVKKGSGQILCPQDNEELIATKEKLLVPWLPAPSPPR